MADDSLKQPTPTTHPGALNDAQQAPVRRIAVGPHSATVEDFSQPESTTIAPITGAPPLGPLPREKK